MKNISLTEEAGDTTYTPATATARGSTKRFAMPKDLQKKLDSDDERPYHPGENDYSY